jgi:transcriptional regulator with XRE-family HTH domain
MTQPELALLIGTSKQTVSNIERGYSGTNDLRRLHRIAEVTAGKGWLPDDRDAIRRYVQGDVDEIPLVMRRAWVAGDLNSEPTDRLSVAPEIALAA